MEKKFLTLTETTKYLGLSCATIYSYTHNKIIPFYKLRGRKLYFLKEEPDNFIINEDNHVKSKTQLENEVLNNIVLGGE